MRIYKIVGIVLSAMLLLASCTNSDLEKKKVKIAYANWLEGPNNIEAFGEISGIGEFKKEKYGKDFLTVINKYLGRN